VSIEARDFEIFSGTGGVGKTTLATSRAIQIAQSGKRVLLITIDPAKRLRELLNLELDMAGEVITVEDPFNTGEKIPLDVELMNPTSTFERIVKESDCEEVLTNRILKILTKPHGGLNEILAIVELNIQFKSGKYDVIVLDTPPGSHFLDFLESVDRIKLFFDQSFIDIFNFLGKKVEKKSFSFGKKMVNIVVSTGVKKLLGYLNKVTGDKFVDDFIDAIIAIYKTKKTFLDALKLQDTLKHSDHSAWYLVTSVEQNKLREALDLKAHARGLITKQSSIILNKCIEENLAEWNPETDSKNFLLKESLLNREKKLKSDLKNHFERILEFPEIFNISPLKHVESLTQSWKQL
jgi:anion-transporting  ArsA/GET3 family ATPase